MASKNTYNDCLKTMYGLRRFGIILGLETIQSILDGLGNPHKKYACVHVAGTNGKGSVAATLASVLFESGYAVGLYTSPHLVRFNERICINNQQISNDEVVRAYLAVKRVHYGDRSPTFFEFATAMALHAFSRHGVDWAVIETGMGGRYDATNVIQPVISIITNVSLEHRDYLGNTLTEIAREKAGIIKPATPVVSGVKQKKARAVVQQVARKNRAPLFSLGREFKVRQHQSGQFSYSGFKNKWRQLRTPLLGGYQIQNAALALAACELLINEQVAITSESIKQGLARTRWAGRLEIVCEHPLVILDGAHNLVAARNLAKYLAANLAGRRITLVIGILDDKPYRSMLNSLLPRCSRAIITRARSERALAPEKLHAIAKKFIAEVRVIPDVVAAARYAIETADSSDVICIAGSLYVVGEAKEAIEKGLLNAILKT